MALVRKYNPFSDSFDYVSDIAQVSSFTKTEEVIDQQQVDYGFAAEIGRDGINRPLAQTFTTSKEGPLTKLNLRIGHLGSNGSVTFEIRTTDSNGLPTSEVLGSTTLNVIDLPAADDFIDIPFSGVTLSADTMYALVVSAADLAGTLVGFLSSSNPGSYTRGRLYYYVNGEWALEDTRASWWVAGDMYFKEYVIATITVTSTEITKQLTKEVNYYIDPVNGDDNNDGSVLNPFRTIQHALDSLPRFITYGVYIWLRDGTYNEEVSIGSSFPGGKGFTGDGWIVIAPEGWSGSVLVTSDGDVVKVRNNHVSVYIGSGIDIRTTGDNKSCVVVEDNWSDLWLESVKFGDNDNANTFGVSCNGGFVSIKNCSDIDSNKVSTGVYATNNSIVFRVEGLWFGDTELQLVNGALVNTSILDAISRSHNQNTDTKLDEGGASEVSAVEVKDVVSTALRSTTERIDYYVDPVNGNDNNNGSQANPFKTIQHAINLLPRFINHPVFIWLEDGTYNEKISIGKIWPGGDGFTGDGFLNIVASGYSGNVLITTNDDVVNISNNHVGIYIGELSIRTTANSKRCLRLTDNFSDVWVEGVKFGDNGNTGTVGVQCGSGLVYLRNISDIDSNKVDVGVRSEYGAIVFNTDVSKIGVTHFQTSDGGIIVPIDTAEQIRVGAGRNSDVVTNVYLRSEGDTPMNLSPFVAPYNLTLVAMSASCASAAAWTAEIHVNGVLKTGATLSVSNSISAYKSTYDIDFNEGDLIQIYMNGADVNRPHVDAVFRRRI